MEDADDDNDEELEEQEGEDDQFSRKFAALSRREKEIRAKEASKTGADCVAVGCPFCMTMMSDGLKEIGDVKPVKDISEIMLENLNTEEA